MYCKRKQKQNKQTKKSKKTIPQVPSSCCRATSSAAGNDGGQGQKLNSGTSLTRDEKKLPDIAQVVVCGAGVVGASVAYHLPKIGFRDVLLLEQGR